MVSTSVCEGRTRSTVFSVAIVHVELLLFWDTSQVGLVRFSVSLSISVQTKISCFHRQTDRQTDKQTDNTENTKRFRECDTEGQMER